MSLDLYNPSAITLAAPVRGPRWTLRIGILGFLLLLVWAHFGEIDQITRAPAQIIAAERTQVVQSPDGGVLSEIYIREGDAVVPGQLLAVLEQSRTQAMTNDSAAKVAALYITLERLEAEIKDRPLAFRRELLEYSQYIANQTNLYQMRRKSIDEDLDALRTSLKLVEQELSMNESLLVTGDVSRVEVLRLRRQVADLAGQITSRRNRYLQEAQAEMTRAQEELRTQTENLRDRTQQLNHTQLKSPAAGVVKNVLVTTVGGVLRAGEVLAEIVPTNSDLIAEAKVSPADIAFIKVGQSATVSLDAYDTAIFGNLPGKVSYISPDTLSDNTADPRQAARQTFYRVQVKLEPVQYPTTDKRSLVSALPGMTASISIKSRERSVLSYLTKPITKTLDNSLGEH